VTRRTRSVSVLIVEDDFMVAKIHRKYVEDVDGFEVIGEARTGAEALQAVAELEPDLVLLDIYLPDMSGLEVLRLLRHEGHPVDVLVVTAARDAETVKESLRGGAVQYLIKPFAGSVMKDRLLEFRRMHRSLWEVGSEDEVKQRDVDALFGPGRRPASVDVDLPKGLTPETLRLVVGALRATPDEGDGTMSASECAEHVGLARVSARRYLEHLVRVGYAEVSLRYGSAGRPERRYRWVG